MITWVKHYGASAASIATSTNKAVVPVAPTLAGNEFYTNLPKTNAARFFRFG